MKNIPLKKEWLKTGGFIAALWTVAGTVGYDHSTKTPDEFLENMGYEPSVITNMPRDVDIQVVNTRNPFTFTRMLPITARDFLAVFRDSIELDYMGIFRAYDIAFSKNTAQLITVNDERKYYLRTRDGHTLESNIYETVDGKKYNPFLNVSSECDALWVFLHEWRHAHNIKTEEHTLSGEIDSDIEAFAAMEALGIDTTELKVTYAYRRILWANAYYFIQGGVLDSHHDSSLALLNNNGLDPNTIAIRTFQAWGIFRLEVEKKLGKNDKDPFNRINKAESLADFRNIIQEIQQERFWETFDYSEYVHADPNHIQDDIALYVQTLLDALQHLEENEITDPEILIEATKTASSFICQPNI